MAAEHHEICYPFVVGTSINSLLGCLLCGGKVVLQASLSLSLFVDL